MKINKCLSQVQAVVYKIIFIVALLEIPTTFKMDSVLYIQPNWYKKKKIKFSL